MNEPNPELAELGVSISICHTGVLNRKLCWRRSDTGGIHQEFWPEGVEYCMSKKLGVSWFVPLQLFWIVWSERIKYRNDSLWNAKFCIFIMNWILIFVVFRRKFKKRRLNFWLSIFCDFLKAFEGLFSRDY